MKGLWGLFTAVRQDLGLHRLLWRLLLLLLLLLLLFGSVHAVLGFRRGADTRIAALEFLHPRSNFRVLGASVLRTGVLPVSSHLRAGT